MKRSSICRRRVLRWFGALGLALLAGLVVLALYLRRDTTGEFLAARDRIVILSCEESRQTETSRIERLGFFDREGEHVGRALVRRPRDLAAVRRTVVVYAGKTTGEQILGLIPEAPDLVLVAPLYPDIEPESTVGALLWPRDLRRAVFSTVASGMAAFDYLLAEGVDRGRTVALAVSLGTAFGTIHTALDPRIDELVIVHGGGDFPQVLHQSERGRNRPVRAAVLPWAAELLVDTFDPVRWIHRIEPRPLLLIASRRDRYFPAASIEAVFAAAAEPKRLVWTETGHVGAGKTDIVESILAEVETYLDGSLSDTSD